MLKRIVSRFLKKRNRQLTMAQALDLSRDRGFYAVDWRWVR